MWHNTEYPDPDRHAEAQVHPSVVVIVLALALAGFWSLIYLIGQSLGVWQ